MTGAYGMGADNIIEAEIVTPTGDVLTANACQNEDIFWAIRGGGGGTFGVILSVTVKAYPIPSMELAGFNISPTNGTSSRGWWKFIARVHQVLPKLQDSGIHGYYTMSGAPPKLSGSFLLFDAQNGTIERRLSPFKKLLGVENKTVSADLTNTWAPSSWDLMQNMPTIEDIGRERSIRSSRLIPRRAVMEDIGFLADIFEKIGPKSSTPTVSLLPLNFYQSINIYKEWCFQPVAVRHDDSKQEIVRQRLESRVARLHRPYNHFPELERQPA